MVFKKLIWILLCFILFAKAQTKSFSDKDVKQYWTKKEYTTNWNVNKDFFFDLQDTLTYFADDKNYKGLLNYGISFKRKNTDIIVNSFEYYSKFYLGVTFSKCKFSVADSIISIEGTVFGGQKREPSLGHKLNNSAEIYIANSNSDTLVRVKNRNNLTDDVYFNNKKLNKNVVLDSFPALYIKDYKKYVTKNTEEPRFFSITSKINKNSILIITLKESTGKSILFDIGKMVFNKTEIQKTDVTTLNDDLEKSKQAGFYYIIKGNRKIDLINELEFNADETKFYYDEVTIAENQIIKKLYKNAALTYDELFKKSKYLYARDIHNAIRCNLLIKDYKTAKKWIDKMILKGVPETYFDSKIFDAIKQTTYWLDFKKDYIKLNQKFNKNYDKEYADKINDLVDFDQTIANKYLNNNDFGEIKKSSDTITNNLVLLFDKEGYPTEEKIGVQLRNGTTISISPNYYVLFIHAHQRYDIYKIKELRQHLLKASKTFSIDSKRINLNDCYYDERDYVVYKGDLYRKKGAYKDIDFENKVKFSFKDINDFLIYNKTLKVIAVDSPDEDSTDIKEKFDFITKLTDDWYFYEKK